MRKVSKGAAREAIDLAEYTQQRDSGTIVTDDRRRRPLWFDGRFLDAGALNAEQQYTLARQSDIALAAGFGVINGLGVTVAAGKSRSIVVDAGSGLTPSGHQVVLPERLSVDLANMAESRQLDASFGLRSEPGPSPINRTGLFIVALRSVEYTANPIAAYPTHIDAPRTVNDGSVIEATAISLIPYADGGANSELAQRRQAVAREVFFEQSSKAAPEDVLPLAMLALERGVIVWLDEFMVRREIAQRESRLFGLGVSPRVLRAAHLRQYSRHLEELQQSLGSAGRIVATDHFSVLPPAAPMPVNGINPANFSQRFFPAEIDVSLSIVPEDELPALLEDSLLLPPLDLELSGSAQESTSVLVLMPVPRHEYRNLSESLPTLLRELAAAQPGMVAKRKPVFALNQLLLSRPTLTATSAIESADSVWRNQLSQQTLLWYVRRRNLHYQADVTSWSVTLNNNETELEDGVRERVRDLGLDVSFNAILERASTGASARIVSLLASPVMLEGPTVVISAALVEIASAAVIDSRSVMLTTERFSKSRFGEGLARLLKFNDRFTGNTPQVENLAASGLVPELDGLMRELPDAALASLAEQLTEAGAAVNDDAKEKTISIIKEQLASRRTPELRGPFVNRPVERAPRPVLPIE